MVSAWKRIVLISAVAIALWPVAICAQARSRYQWKTVSVGSFGTPGGDFSTYSSGIGGLRGAGRGSPTGILKSSLTSNYNLHHGGSAAPAGTLGTALPKFSSLKGRSYGGTKIGLIAPTEGANAPKLMPDIHRVGTISGAQSDLLSRVKPATTSSTSKPAKAKALSSFVPSGQGQYRKFMKSGDQAFRSERFIESSESFDVAIAMGRYLPESHLSLVHAHFATGRYYSASHHLRQALKYFPDLPIVFMRVRLFYGRSETFVHHVDELRQEIEDSGPDADLLFLLSYFRYFDGEEADAAKLLRQAWNAAGKNNPATTEAIETFWSGMVDAGKVEGTLGAATPDRPAPVSRDGQDKPADGKAADVRQPTTAPTGPTGKNEKKPTEKKTSPEKGQDKE